MDKKIVEKPKAWDLLDGGNRVIAQVREQKDSYDCALFHRESGNRGNVRIPKYISERKKRWQFHTIYWIYIIIYLRIAFCMWIARDQIFG